MKKISIALLLIIASNIVYAQDKAFQKGDIVIDFSAGIGVYGTKIHQEYNKNVVTWNGSGFSTSVKRIKNDTVDAAASYILPLCFEYGITNWLGIGARFAYSNYFSTVDSANQITPKITGVDGDLLLNLHLIKTKRFDMPIRITIGYSNFKYETNNNMGSMAKDDGINYGISLVPRIYFGQHIGMFANIGYAGYHYPNLLFSDNTNSNINKTQDWLYQLKGDGANIGIGFMLKF